MNNLRAEGRLSRRLLGFLAAGALAVGIATPLALWPQGAAAGTIPGGARVVTVTPVFGTDPNISRHHLDHAFTITDPAKVARIEAIINGLARFPIGALSCTRGNDAAMKLTFKTSAHGRAVATVFATYTGCQQVWFANPDRPPLQDYTRSGKQLQRLVLSIAGVRWPYTPNALPPMN
jgi:hypothetical protein